MEQLTYQEALQKVFDIVSHHLLRQGRKSAGSRGCMYRYPRDNEVLMCAVGCLIGNEHYNEDIEYKPVSSYSVLEAISKSNPWIEPHKLTLIDALSTLQNIHDTTPPKRWRELLKKFAEARGLIWNLK